LITIYDCKIDLTWSGKASDGTQVEGRLSIPEVSHEITLDGLSDYVYSWTIKTNSSPAVDALFALAKSRLPTALETKFAEFPAALVETHGKDLTVSTDPSRSGTPAPPVNASNAPAPNASASASTAASSVSQPSKKADPKTKTLNTARVTVEASFMADANVLFDLLTNEKKIPLWTHASAKSTAQVDSEYSLFSGGVVGKYISITPPTEIVQSWSLKSPTWPSGHFATLTTTLVQSSDSTNVKFLLDGVPTGMESEIRRNLEGYYIHGFKSIGYVPFQIFHPPTLRKQDRVTSKKNSDVVATIVVACLVLVVAFSIPFFSSS